MTTAMDMEKEEASGEASLLSSSCLDISFLQSTEPRLGGGVHYFEQYRSLLLCEKHRLTYSQDWKAQGGSPEYAIVSSLSNDRLGPFVDQVKLLPVVESTRSSRYYIYLYIYTVYIHI